ncbi:anti-sigma factor antagonist [Curvibacter sp. CHRR-16]|uniref:hypothetical protein n=1 Tax=Curvibacter sp. CHRR-16 TaxID=2835872 RepID=UPI001BDA464A|nr:hypothetical protein [Curvibacter sp. CHRR-16]MBT0571452.1 anti-sigma factor antagonist [Curvibacter sp. CHRR-16]
MPIFELPTEFNIYSAQKCHEALLACLQQVHQSDAQAPVLHVHADQVAQVDAAGLQILVALGKTAYQWHLVEPSNVLQQACQDYGLQACLQQHTRTDFTPESV